MRRSIRTGSQLGICKLWMFVVCAGILLSAANPVAQGAPGGIRPYKLPRNLLEYFKGKYPHIDDSVSARLQETPDGPLGQIDITGKIPPKAAVTGMTPKDRARAIARAFLDDEAALLDIADPAEIKEGSVTSDDQGSTVVQYLRYVGGLELTETLIRVDVDADGTITRFHANLTPAPAELYKAVARKPISEDEVRTIIERDLKTPDQQVAPKISEPKRIATYRPPYVLWQANGSVGLKPAWGYVIHAFTGEILGKNCTSMGFRFTPGRTPCD